MVEGLAARLEDDPGDLDGWLRLGRSYGVLGELAKTSAAFGEAAKLAPDDVAVLVSYADALMAEAGPDAAPPPAVVALYERILDLDPGHVDALWMVAMARAESGDLEGSIGLLEHLLSALPEGNESHVMIQGLIDELRP
jgi:cytochrome c-type biogenesis protein CcmH